MELITLGGFLPLSKQEAKDLKKSAKAHNVECYPAYFESWELRGEAANIEQVTKDLWNMGRDEWAENALSAEAAHTLKCLYCKDEFTTAAQYVEHKQTVHAE